MQQSGSYPHHLARSDSLLKKGFMIQLMLMRLFNFLLFSSLACWLIGLLARWLVSIVNLIKQHRGLLPGNSWGVPRPTDHTFNSPFQDSQISH